MRENSLDIAQQLVDSASTVLHTVMYVPQSTIVGRNASRESPASHDLVLTRDLLLTSINFSLSPRRTKARLCPPTKDHAVYDLEGLGTSVAEGSSDTLTIYSTNLQPSRAYGHELCGRF